jgi:hypothetical protein
LTAVATAAEGESKAQLFPIRRIRAGVRGETRIRVWAIAVLAVLSALGLLTPSLVVAIFAAGVTVLVAVADRIHYARHFRDQSVR